MPETVPIIQTTEQQRKKFSCGVHPLNDFLKRYSVDNHLKGLGRTFVLIVQEQIVGYYTICTGSAEFNNIDGIEQLPKYPIPIALCARLAVSKEHQKKGWGEWLLTDALHRICKASQEIGIYAVIVDAKDDMAKNFYEKYGFIAFPTKPLSLYLMLASYSDLIK